jgi:hypothetical protein
MTDQENLAALMPFLDEPRRRRYWQKAQGIDPANIVAHWAINDKAGSVAEDISPQGNDGVHTAVSLAQPGIGDGWTSGLYDGSTSVTALHSAGFEADLDLNEISIALFGKMSGAGVWTDGSEDRIFNMDGAAGNFYLMRKSSANNQLDVLRKANGQATQTRSISSFSPSGFFHFGFTASRNDDEFKLYIAGAQSGSTLTSLPLFSGPLNVGGTVLGAGNTGAALAWNGYIQHVIIWKSIRSLAEFGELATV